MRHQTRSSTRSDQTRPTDTPCNDAAVRPSRARPQSMPHHLSSSGTRTLPQRPAASHKGGHVAFGRTMSCGPQKPTAASSSGTIKLPAAAAVTRHAVPGRMRELRHHAVHAPPQLTSGLCPMTRDPSCQAAAETGVAEDTAGGRSHVPRGKPRGKRLAVPRPSSTPVAPCLHECVVCVRECAVCGALRYMYTGDNRERDGSAQPERQPNR